LDFSETDRNNTATDNAEQATSSAPLSQERGEERITEAQRFTDNIVRTCLLWLFPSWSRPNHLTILRFILTPVVLLLLHYELRWWAFVVFVIAICTDFIDGAMARTRDQITKVGIIIDPVADKLLVGSVLAWIGYEYLVVQIILAFIALELLMMAVGLRIARPGDRVRMANAFGKAKMVVQSLALIIFLVAGMLDIKSLITVSLFLLWVAIALAVLSGLKHVVETLTERRQSRQSRRQPEI
jgi:CDP-diacylglycerol--glycerol-3-phosphate 3-phosphatidyltransferase